MEVTVEHRDDCTIVSICGRFVMDSTIDAENKLLPIIEQAKPTVIVQLAQVDYIDSSGAGILVHFLQKTRKSKRRLILTQLHPSLERVFKHSNLDKVFEIADTLDEAFQLIHPRKIFLFDNREDIIFFYGEVLQANHMIFSSGMDLKHSLEVLKEDPVDLIIVDALEKDEPKYSFVRCLKQDEKLCKIPIVALSIYEEEEFQFSQFGVNRFILKPFLVERFVATLKQLLTHD